ncbi:hypothetical protein KKF34_11620 [Myxococcota bacterium]|nr:hypothetical protein [Myxococcota bacterium]MBU1381505.1 hypothetical protein [Myxococcota bacterium]MBU1497512.1 hypothetical protein [Myxococcota bacterium]
MGFFSAIFNKEERASRALEKNLATAINKRIQPEDRYNALIFLRNLGTPEAIYGLLRRFTIVADGKGGVVTDEEEREWVSKALLNFGETALPQIKKFIFAKEGPTVSPVHSVSQALELYRIIINSDEKMIELLKELIEANPPGYERDPLRKEEILSFLIDWKRGDLAEAIIPYIEDTNETIRFMTVEYLLKFAPDDLIREPLLGLFLPEKDESLRVKNKILHAIIEREWSIKNVRSYVESILNENEHQVFRGEFIKKKAGSK